MTKRILALLLGFLMLFSVASAAELTVGDVNDFLNHSAKLGEGSKANPVAIIPFNHIDGPQEEDLFYAFVPFKYVARNYVKYQVCFISCTCRAPAMNLWTTAYIELTLPESGKIDDSAIRTLSFDVDSTGHYLGGFWGDSNPPPSGQTYEQFKNDWLPFYTGKTYAQLKDYSTIADIALEDYRAGEGRESLEIDAWTGATVSSNNVLRIIQAMFAYHATDSFFDKDETALGLREVFSAKREVAAQAAQAVAVSEDSKLPAPVDRNKTYKPSKDATEELPCEMGNFGLTCSAITSQNLMQYLGRTDVMYIDVRDHSDYIKKHLRNFESIPFFGLIYNKEAHLNADLPQLYGGDSTDPVPVYAESDEILEALFPKDQTLFIMCQSGGRVKLLMNILKARGWDMSKVYNVGGMAQYTGPEYRNLVTDTPELTMTVTYSVEGLTRVAPAK